MLVKVKKQKQTNNNKKEEKVKEPNNVEKIKINIHVYWNENNMILY